MQKIKKNVSGERERDGWLHLIRIPFYLYQFVTPLIHLLCNLRVAKRGQPAPPRFRPALNEMVVTGRTLSHSISSVAGLAWWFPSGLDWIGFSYGSLLGCLVYVLMELHVVSNMVHVYFSILFSTCPDIPLRPYKLLEKYLLKHLFTFWLCSIGWLVILRSGGCLW